MESVLPIWVSPAWAAAAVAGAAALAWLGARSVVAVPAGPTLPERLQQWRSRHQAGLAIALGLLVFSGIHAWWAIPAVWLAFQAAAHRVRTRVFGDTWSLAAQVRWNLRALAGVIGFWWMVSLAPFALASLAAPAWAGPAAAVVLLAWNHFYGAIVIAALGATPLDRPEVLAAFEPVLARARVPRPRLLRAGPRGALLANAFAMASARGDVVLFFDGFLDHASPAEAAAVLGHELGHLEEFATRRAQLYAPGALLAVAGAIVSVAVALGVWPAWIAAGWFGVPMLALIARAFRSQDRERASDRRAVELCGGDGEALVRALVLLHTLSHVPRRFDPEIERHATHPSLARRIAAIRALGGVPPALIEPRAFACDGSPSRAVVFDATRFALVTTDGAADLADAAGLVQHARQVEAVAYTELTELRLAPVRDGSATLIATDRQRNQRRVTIAAADVAAVQAMLDLADQRMPATAAPPDLRPLGRIAALVATCVALPAFAWGVLGAALLACIRPTAPLLAAASAGLGVVAALRPPQVSPDWSVLLFTTAAIACGTLAVRHIQADRRAGIPFRVDAFLVAGFVVTGLTAAIPAALIVALGRGDLGRLHAAARAFTMAAPAFAALGAYCVAVPRRAARVAGAGAFAAMVAAGTLGSDEFRDLVVPDPLIADAAPRLVVDDLTSKAEATVSQAGSYVNLWLAPDARHVILQETRSDDGQGPDGYVVAALDGWRREIVAAQVSFLDAASLFVVRNEERISILSVEPVRGGAPRWSLRLEDPPAGEFEVDASGRWRLEPHLSGGTAEARGVRLEGRIGESTVRRTVVRTEPRGVAYVKRQVSGTGSSIQVASRWDGRGPWMVDAFFPTLGWNGEIERIGGRAPGVLARSRSSIRCLGPSLTSPSATCLATTGDETFVWEVAADSGPPVPTAYVDGSILPMWHDRAAVLAWHGGDLLLLWRGTNRATRIGPGRECPCPHGAAYADGRIATLTAGPDRSTVRLYAVSPPVAPLTASAAAVD